MKRPVHLPLYHEFLELFDNYEIQNWEANLFWLNIEHLSQIETKEQRQQMYNGLRVLTSNDYLRVEYSKYNRRIFLYSETLKLHQFRRNVLAENYNEVINPPKYIKDFEKFYKEINHKIFEEHGLEEFFLFEEFPAVNLKSFEKRIFSLNDKYKV